jgi:hypothetical protein
MKKSGADLALLTPDADGWRLSRAGVAPQKFATLGEAAPALPEDVRLHLALPCQAVLLERMTLPATDRNELAGMVQLQLEKTLPFPIEEVSSDFMIVESGENESTLVSAAAQHAQLNALCAPLRTGGRLPEKITPFPMHIAAACPADETVLAVYPEQGQLVAAICEKSRLAWTHVIPALDAETLLGELPQMLLGAEMEGVPTVFARVRLAEECAPLAEVLWEFFQVPVEPVVFDGQLPEPDGNLVPASWQADVERGARAAQWRHRLIVAAVLYVLAVVAAFAYLAWLKSQARKIDAQYAAAQPVLQFVQGQQARWKTLAPAIDATRYARELLYQIDKNRPTEEIHITEFDLKSAVDLKPTVWTVVGEAPSYNLAIDFVNRLKEEKELGAFVIDAPKQPSLLANEHAQFTITGKL